MKYEYSESSFDLSKDIKTLMMDNITKLMRQEDYIELKNNYFKQIRQSSASVSVSVTIKEEDRDAILTSILMSLHKKFFTVLYHGKVIFNFCGREASTSQYYDSKYQMSFNKIFLIEFIPCSYFISNIEDEYNYTFKARYNIRNIFLDLTQKTLHLTKVVLLCEKNGNYSLRSLQFGKCLSNSETSSFAQLRISDKTEIIKHIADKYPFSCFYFIPTENFLLFSKSFVFLFEKFGAYAILLQVVDIAFTSIPFPFVTSNEEFAIMSSELYVYKLSLNTKSTSSYSIFKDISLNFNNEKYKEMLEILKIVMFYNLEIESIPFAELKIYMNSIFQEYDIHSYVENLNSMINEENVVFFINHNLNSSKLQVIVIFCIIFEKFGFLGKILKLLSSTQGGTSGCMLLSNSNDGMSIFNKNINFISFVILLQDLFYDIFSTFRSLDIKSFIMQVNEKILSDLDFNLNLNLNFQNFHPSLKKSIEFYLNQNYFQEDNPHTYPEKLICAYTNLFQNNSN